MTYFSKPPKLITRFYGNDEYALQTVGFKQITLLHFDQLNDPFDFRIKFITDFENDYNKLINWVKDNHYEKHDEFIEKLTEDGWDNFLKKFDEYISNVRESTYVFSTTALEDNKNSILYMWGHYGNGHRGVAIEFDPVLLGTGVMEQTKEDGIPWEEMNYSDEIPKITCEQIYDFVIKAEPDRNQYLELKNPLSIKLREVLRTKSKNWEIENEWRLMNFDDSSKCKTKKFKIKNDAITAIYLGALMDDKRVEDFKFETQNNLPRAKIYKCRMSENNFGIEFDEV